MRSSMVLASLILLIIAARAHGLRRIDMQLQHTTMNKKELIMNSKWQASGGHRMDTRRASEDGHGSGRMKQLKTSPCAVAPRFNEDYSGPDGHSPNHHRTKPCGPCY